MFDIYGGADRHSGLEASVIALGRQCLTIIEAFEVAIINPITLYIGWMEYTEIGKFKTCL